MGKSLRGAQTMLNTKGPYQMVPAIMSDPALIALLAGGYGGRIMQDLHHAGFVSLLSSENLVSCSGFRRQGFSCTCSISVTHPYTIHTDLLFLGCVL